MKVVFINCASNGSTGNIINSIHRSLTERGDESFVFYGVGDKKDNNYFRVGNYFSLHFHSVMSKLTGRHGYFSFFPTLKMINKIRKINPDIIHLHNLHGYYLCLPLLFCFLKKRNAKIIITLHDCWLFTGKCPYFTACGCNSWKDKCGRCPQLGKYPPSRFIDCTKGNLKAKKRWLKDFKNLEITAVSHWLEGTARESFLSEYPIKCIYNGIDTDIFYPRATAAVKEKYRLTDKKVILGVATDWKERKGLEEFLELANSLGDDEVIVLVGLSKKQIENLPKNIYGIERTENKDELAELYSAADVFINASKEETFGLVTAEALACGTSVIVYDSTACAEVVVNQSCGRIAENKKALFSAAKELLDCCGKKDVKSKLDECFENKKMIAGYLNEYKQ